ncbi:hypothetical protein J1N35_040350 [Gossypium stocksii]|uniref:Uncharacterized protein n=1 Tax=Gossypium stocksii TaxID=47602 RepID=A0A9D3ZI94_9ROSI|nr:hypothetical protein J1N35_040350 [Gossypium stocksii]
MEKRRNGDASGFQINPILHLFIRHGCCSFKPECCCFGGHSNIRERQFTKLLLTSDHGNEAEIYLFGGYITSWKDMVFQWRKVTEEESQEEEEEEEQRHGV